MIQPQIACRGNFNQGVGAPRKAYPSKAGARAACKTVNNASSANIAVQMVRPLVGMAPKQQSNLDLPIYSAAFLEATAADSVLQ